MEIRYNHHYQGWIQEHGQIIAEAGFYSEDSLGEATEVIQGDSDMLLCIGLDITKEPNRAYGCYDFFGRLCTQGSRDGIPDAVDAVDNHMEDCGME